MQRWSFTLYSGGNLSNIDRAAFFFCLLSFPILCYFPVSLFIFLPTSRLFSFLSDVLSFLTLFRLFLRTLISAFFQASLPFFFKFFSSFFFLYFCTSLFLLFLPYTAFFSIFSSLFTSSLVALEQCYRHTHKDLSVPQIMWWRYHHRDSITEHSKCEWSNLSCPHPTTGHYTVYWPIAAFY